MSSLLVFQTPVMRAPVVSPGIPLDADTAFVGHATPRPIRQVQRL